MDSKQEFAIPSGLKRAEAALRLRSDGPNELPSRKTSGLLAIALQVMREPMFLLLGAAGAIYCILGDLHEALILLSFVVMIMGITIYQERKTERALEALRDLSSPRALVVRDGTQQRIPGREVVRGDLLILNEGDRVAADAVLLSCNDLRVDESLLTGESVPVSKIPWDGTQQLQRPGGDNLPFIFSGTLLVQGKGTAEVLTTGAATEIGKIGKVLQTITAESTPLQQKTGTFVRKLAIAGLLLSATVVILYGLNRGDWLAGTLAGITLAMALLPQEFPVVVTVFLALGAWRISHQRVLTRNIPAIEALGSTTVLCVDKTGTLTLNRMKVRKLYAGGGFLDIQPDPAGELPEQFHELVEYGILASEIEPFDPMEKALMDLGQRFLSQTEHLHYDWALKHEYALTPELLAHTHAWKTPEGHGYIVATKGAPEAIADLCHLPENRRDDLAGKVKQMATEGLRVLGVARARFDGPRWPDGQHDFDFELVGLVGLADPVRPTVAAALADCYSAGIRVVMITGDYPGTAQAIARQIGLAQHDQIITGSELDGMGDAELQQRIRNVNVFARVVPEQKLRIVSAFKANGEIVAMTGDGVNDAPALKAAHIGVAMGARGTDVAREAASLTLLDDDFASIVGAMRMGRRIYDNIRHAMTYIMAVHVPTAGMSLFPLLLGWPLMLFPVHIVFLEFVIDPACSIAFEAEPGEKDLMQRRPRDPRAPLFSGLALSLSLLQGVGLLIIVGAVYAYSLGSGASGNEARALAFTTIVLGNLGLILANRSHVRPLLTVLRTPNAALWWIVCGTLIGLALVMLFPPLRDVFRFAPLHPREMMISAAATFIAILWFELVKRFPEISGFGNS
ncbi:MAG TPA: cation-translocating P-type ATPase [Burkholderiales bacterium]|nr:cation-translocating P-type ATPase [Burkholderiales bacterium]